MGQIFVKTENRFSAALLLCCQVVAVLCFLAWLSGFIRPHTGSAFPFFPFLLDSDEST
jgi:hypothetical protein